MCNAAVDAGTVVVVSVGNYGPGPSSVGGPAAADRFITVGASTNSGRLALFSGRGPTLDGRVKPDLIAPGSAIMAAQTGRSGLSSQSDSPYASRSGTSMSAPFVAGLCALLRTANTELGPDDVKSIITATAHGIGLSGNEQGAGQIDAHAAVQ